MDEKSAVASLAALAQGMRLRVFRALVGAGPQGMTPGALSATLDVPASTLSFHLKELMQAGLVSQQRDGRNLIYRPAIEQMKRPAGLPDRALLPGRVVLANSQTRAHHLLMKGLSMGDVLARAAEGCPAAR